MPKPKVKKNVRNDTLEEVARKVEDFDDWRYTSFDEHVDCADTFDGMKRLAAEIRGMKV